MVERFGGIWLVVVGVLSFATVAPVSAADSPAEIAGLVAWYDTDSLHANKRDGATVERWNDSSRHGHTLKGAWEEYAPPEFDTLVLNDLPVVRIGDGTHYDVTQPFELEDHTIFLVFSSQLTKRALFRSDTDPKSGVILGQDGQSHFFQDATAGLFPYNRATPLDRGFTITVLGRASGVLHAFVNGADISSGAKRESKIRVGRFFELEHTTFVGSDGEGLSVAEMIFYDRYLTDEERAKVTGYLSEKFAIPVESGIVERTVVDDVPEIEIDERAVLARLGTSTAADVNVDLVAVKWDAPVRVEAPLRFDAGSASTELHCERDATRVRLSLILPLRSDTAGTSVRVLVLVNGRDYLPQEAVAGPFEAAGARLTLRYQTTLTLNSGDFLEIVASGVGAAGPVKIDPDGAVLIAERIE